MNTSSANHHEPVEAKILKHPGVFTGLWRWVYLVLGMAMVGLAILGVLLPILPTTPFVLLASYFFVRSSPRLHRWLLGNRLFGPMLRDWRDHGAVRRRVKVMALLMMMAGVSASIYFGNLSWPLVVMLLVLALIGGWVVIRLPEIGRGKKAGGIKIKDRKTGEDLSGSE